MSRSVVRSHFLLVSFATIKEVATITKEVATITKKVREVMDMVGVMAKPNFC